jgi:MFS family permease
MQPASSSIVIGSFAPEERGKAMGVYISIPLLFLTLGPLIGGLLTTYVSWHAVFFLNLPIAAAAIAITAVVRPPNGPRRTSAVRPTSLFLYLLGLPPLVFGIQQSVAWGWSTPAVFVPIVLGFLACVTFIAFERRNQTPLLSLRLFDDRSFLGAALVLFFQQFAVTGQVFFVSRYLQNELGFNPSQAGAGLLPMLIPTILVAHLAGRMYDRTGARRPLLIGSILAFAGLATEAIVSPWHSYPALAIGLGLFGLGVGFLGSPAHTDALSRAGAERRGQASGLLGTMRQVGSSLGIAVLGALVAAHGASAGHWAGAAAFLVTFLCAFFLIGPPAHRAPSAGTGTASAGGSPPRRGAA